MAESRDLKQTGTGKELCQEYVVRGNDLLTESSLRDLSKNLRALISDAKSGLDDGDIKQLQDLLEALLRTAEHANLTPPHRAAACNALCGFVDQGSSSRDLRIRSICLASTVWIRMLEVFLYLSVEAKPKPMRQVLITVYQLLVANPDEYQVAVLLEYSVLLCLSLIHEFDNVVCVKPAMQLIELFLSKRVLDIMKFVSLGRESSDTLSTESSGLGSLDSLSKEFIHNHLTTLLQWARHSDIAPMAGRLFITFVRLTNTIWGPRIVVESKESTIVWSGPLQSTIEEEPDLIETLEQHVLPDLFQLDIQQTSEWLKLSSTLCMSNVDRRFREINFSPADLRLFLAAFKVLADSGGSSNIMLEEPSKEISNHEPPLIIVTDLLVHPSPPVRLAALSLALSLPPAGAAIPVEVLRLMQKCISHFHGEGDAKARNEFVAFAKRFFIRLRALASCTRRSTQTKGPDMSSRSHSGPDLPATEEKASRVLATHEDFTSWYIRFLIDELQPTASYQRHITALHVLLHAINLVVHESMKNEFMNRLKRSLLDLHMDPFDDVRRNSSILLNILLQSSSGKSGSMNETLPNSPVNSQRGPGGIDLSNQVSIDRGLVLQRAEAFMRSTGRADYADGVGMLYQLLYTAAVDDIGSKPWYNYRSLILEHLSQELEKDVDIATQSLSMAVENAPLHGRLISLRYIISQPEFYHSIIYFSSWRQLHDRLIRCCVAIWNVVKDILCLGSPEGTVATDLDDDDLDIGEKDTLSFSWRAIKEASSLLQTMITNNTYAPRRVDDGLGYYDFRQLGELTFTQLAELRHRGAFSTVSQTFAACCIRCCEDDEEAVKGLPRQWYKDTLTCIRQKGRDLTRRSAGLPAMITGVLAAHPAGNFLDQVIQDLQRIAEEPFPDVTEASDVHLSQVHALNCLRNVFTDTRLGTGTEPHVAGVLDIAARCLDAERWAIQNCGLMLLKSLLNRLSVGSNKSTGQDFNTRSSRHIYKKYPNLQDFVLRMLQKSQPLFSSSNARESVAYSEPSSPVVKKVFTALEVIERLGVPEDQDQKYKRLIRQVFESPVWHLREKAARVLNSLVREQDRLTEMKEALQEPWRSQNDLHGKLLYLNHMVSRNGRWELETLKQTLNSMLSNFDGVFLRNRCHVTAVLYLEILASILEHILQLKGDFGLKTAPRYGEELWEKWRIDQVTLCDAESLQAEATIDRIISATAACIVLFERIDCGKKSNESSINTIAKGLRRVDYMPNRVLNFVRRYSKTGRLYQLRLFRRLYKEMFKSGDFQEDQQGKSFLESSITLRCYSTEIFASLTLADFENQQEYHKELLESCDYFSWNANEQQRTQAQLYANQDTSNAELVIQGIFASIFESNIGSVYHPLWSNSFQLGHWIRRIRLASNYQSDVPTRLAAAVSIQNFQESLRPANCYARGSPEYLGIYLALYDILNDDDDDVREKGAEVVSWVLSVPNTATQPSTREQSTSFFSLNPPAASLGLLELLSSKYNSSEDFCIAVIERLTGLSGDPDVEMKVPIRPTRIVRDALSRSVSDLLRDAQKEDTHLFVEEKQNLYLDEVKEVEKWSRAFPTGLTEEFLREIMPELCTWLENGIENLVKTAERNLDGPLGWTSKPEVYTLGMRVIMSSRVINRAIKTNSPGDQAMESRHSKLSESLQNMLDVGTRQQLHGSWLKELESAVQEDA